MDKRVMDLLNKMEGWEALNLESEEIDDIKKLQEAQGREIASFFHQAFVQNDAGARVLEIFMNQTLLKPTVRPASTQFEAGIREGRADLVRQILLNIALAESGQ